MPQQETLLAELDPQPRTVSSRRKAESEITQIVSAALPVRLLDFQGHRTVSSLKQQKRQARIAASTIASLKELQKVA